MNQLKKNLKKLKEKIKKADKLPLIFSFATNNLIRTTLLLAGSITLFFIDKTHFKIWITAGIYCFINWLLCWSEMGTIMSKFKLFQRKK